MTNLPCSEFNRNFARLNGIENEFSKWHFDEGMRFNDELKWWGDKGLRKIPHEGIDLLWFLNQAKNRERCSPHSLVPALLKGKIVAIFPDFLGHSILFKHTFSRQNSQLYSILGHVSPIQGIHVGHNWKNLAQPVARFSPAQKKQILPSHLHVSLFWGAENIVSDQIDWETISHPSCNIDLIDPLSLIG